MLQEFVGYYDPAEHTLVFVLLPSKTGNSVAIWREKVEVPPNLRVLRVRDVELAKAALKKDYPVTVDEWYVFMPYTLGGTLTVFSPLQAFSTTDHPQYLSRVSAEEEEEKRFLSSSFQASVQD